MNHKYRTLVKWLLHGLLFLLVMMVQTVILGNRTFWGAKLSLVPVAVACVACREGHESGGVFALAAGLLWCLSGVSGGSAYLLLLPVSAVICGYFCSTYLTRSLLPCAAGCLLTLTLAEGGAYLQRYYLGGALPAGAGHKLAVQILLSMPACPLFWAVSRAVSGKAGD